MPSKPKNNDKNPAKDRCGTPSYGLTPLLPYLPIDWVIWEPAAGEGLLVDALEINGYKVIRGDILTGQNYFAYEPETYDCQVTNMPFSIKYEWLERAYLLGKPFALLAPTDTMCAGKKAQSLFKKFGWSVLLPDKRIDFKMPNKGWGGTAQLHTSWFCWQLEMPQGVTFVTLNKPRKSSKRVLTDQMVLHEPHQPKLQQMNLF